MRLLIAGGGTGGHLFPGIAVAEEVLQRGPDHAILFVGTRRGLEAKLLPELGYPVEYIQVSGLKGTGFVKRLQGLSRLPGALWDSLRLVRRFQPDLAMGVGGYASGPTVLAARMSGVPTVILEQNSVPGITNRWLARWVDAVFIAFERSASFFPPRRTKLLGNPVRRALRDAARAREPRADERFRVLVLGGSQGARGLNHVVVGAAERLAGRPIRWTHQTGARHLEDVQARYARAQGRIDAQVYPFIQDMGTAYRQADLVVGRAGATSIAELMVARKASILVPFPHATDDHQSLNAQVLADAGAALMFSESRLDAETLADAVGMLSESPDRIARMEAAAACLGRPDAAREIVNACEALLRERKPR